MPRYQIIIETDENLTDQEFRQIVEDNMSCAQYGDPFLGKYTRIIQARNLEGIRQEVYEPFADLL